MVFPNTVLGTKVELYYDDAWHNIVTDTPLGADEPNSRVRGQGAVDGEIEITARGQPDESSNLTPTQAKLSVNNKDGKYSPRNTASTLYGKIGKNTPLRIATDLTSTVSVVDSFDTDGTNGWPVSDSEHTYTTIGGAAGDYLVTGGKGIHRTNATNTRYRTRLAALTITDFDCYLTGITMEAAPTGGQIQVGVRGRVNSTTDFVEGKILFQTDGSVDVNIRESTNSVEVTSSSVEISGATVTETISLRFQAEGRTLRLKVWETANAEPAAWAVEMQTIQLIPGAIEVTSFVSSGVTNALPFDVSFDSLLFSLGIILFTGEVVEWPKRWDKTGRDVWVPIVATGVTRRKRQGNRPARSALYNYLRKELTNEFLPGTEPTPNHYWPLERLTQQIRDIRDEVDGATVMRFDVATHNTVEWSSNDFVVGSDKLVTITGLPIPEGVVVIPFISNFVAPPLGEPVFTPPDVSDADTFSFGLWFYFPPLLDGFPFLPATSIYLSFAVPDSAIQNIFIDVQYRPDTAEIDVTLDSTSGDLTGTDTMAYTDAPHFLLVDMFVDGSDTWQVDVYIDGNPTATDTASFRPFAHITRFDIEVEPYSPVTLGHVVMETNNLFTRLLSFSDVIESAGNGFSGETAVARFERIMTAEGLAYEVFEGELDTDHPTTLGPQKTGNLIDYLDDIRLADDGLIYEMRTPAGYGFRTRQSLYGIPDGAHLELNYTATDLGEVPEVNDDDQRTRNIIRAKRRGGTAGELTHIIFDGPQGTNNAGDYEDGGIEVALNSEEQIADWVGWRGFLGTWDEDRWPSLTVYLHREPFTTNLEKWVKAIILEIGEIISIANKPVWLGSDSGAVLQQMRAVSIRLSNFQIDLNWTLLPGGPYAALNELNNPEMSRVDTNESVLLSSVDSDDTEFIVETQLTTDADGHPMWTVDPAEYDSWDHEGMVFRVNPASRSGGLGGEKVTTGVVAPVRDTFTRSASQLAGSNADTGQTWTQESGTATDWTINGSAAVALHPAAPGDCWVALPVGDFDISVYVALSVNFTIATGERFIADVNLRYVDTNNNYYIRVYVDTGTDNVIMQARKVVAGSGSQLGSNYTIGDNVSGQLIHIRASIVGRTFLGKVWLGSTEEPEWMHVGYDDAVDAINGTEIGLRSLRVAGNTNVNLTSTWDNLQVHTPKIRPYAWDRFNRTVLNDPTASFPNDSGVTGWSYGWFSAGGGLAADIDFTPNQLNMQVTAANAYLAVYLSQIALMDACVTLVWTAPLATGASLEPGGILMRGTSTTSYVFFRCHATINNQLVIEINAASGASLGSTIVDNLELVGATRPIRVKAACQGDQCMMKAWAANSPEPYDWQLVVTDPAPVAGWIGLRAGRASGNTNGTISQTFHQFEVVNPQKIQVVRSVNGVSKSWDAGSDFRLWQPMRLGR